MFAGGCGVGKRVLGESVELSGTLQPLFMKAWIFFLCTIAVWALDLISFSDWFLCSGLFEGSGSSAAMCHIPLVFKVTLEDCDEVWGERLVF